MPNIGDSERKTQNRVVKFFRDKLHYTYLGNLHDSENRNIMQERLHAWLLKQGYSEKLAANAVDALVKTSTNLQQGLYHANKEVYSLLKYGAKVKESVEQPPKTVYFIDFEDVSKNDFYIAEEVTVVSNNTKRPDIVLYVNGIALAVIELKKSSVSVSNGIRQNLTNQKANFIEDFFTTIQFCMAGNDSEGLRYGTLLTPEKHYLEWKDDGFSEHQPERDMVDIKVEEYCEGIPSKLEKQIFALFYKKRFLDLIHNFVIFDKGIKKVCRYNQYYAIKRAQHRLTDKKRGGIVWHTQGSGKSLTMVWLSKWILANNPNARVLVVTDREELDEQIEKNYKGVDENIVRTKSGKDLLERLNAFDDRLLCSLVHKFGKRGSDSSETDYEKYIECLPEDPQVEEIERLLGYLEKEMEEIRLESERLAEEQKRIEEENRRLQEELARQEEQRLLKEAEEARILAEQKAAEEERRRKLLEEVANSLQQTDTTNMTAGAEDVLDYEYESELE